MRVNLIMVIANYVNQEKLIHKLMKLTTKIELTEKELLAILAEKFNIKTEGATIQVYKYDGDQRDPSYTKITVEGEPKEKSGFKD